MGETTSEVGAVHNPDDGSPDTAQIRSGIEQTRSNLSETIDALQQKLDPANIAEQVKTQIRDKATEAYGVAKSTVVDATVGKAHEIMTSVSDTMGDVTGRAGSVVKDSGTSVWQYVREHPIPIALICAGVGMLTLRRNKPSWYDNEDEGYETGTSAADTSSGNLTDKAQAAVAGATGMLGSATSTVRSAASTAADTTRNQLNRVTEGARRGARTASDGFTSKFQENPLTIGVVALAAGALVGLTMPASDIEREYLGGTRDQLLDQAKSAAHDAVEKVQRVAGEAGRTLKDAAQKEGLMVGQTG